MTAVSLNSFLPFLSELDPAIASEGALDPLGLYAIADYLGVKLAITRWSTTNETTPPIERKRLDSYLSSHLINSSFLLLDNFEEFMLDRQKRLLVLIEQATGRTAYTGDVQEEGDDVVDDEDSLEAEMTISVT